MKQTRNTIYKETIESYELELYANNSRQVYDYVFLPIVENLKKHYAKGLYSHEKALNSFYRMATYASDLYYKDFGHKFDVTARYTVAVNLEKDFFNEIDNY